MQILCFGAQTVRRAEDGGSEIPSPGPITNQLPLLVMLAFHVAVFTFDLLASHAYL